MAIVVCEKVGNYNALQTLYAMVVEVATLTVVKKKVLRDVKFKRELVDWEKKK